MIEQVTKSGKCDKVLSLKENTKQYNTGEENTVSILVISLLFHVISCSWHIPVRIEAPVQVYIYTGVKVPGAEIRFQGHLIDGADTGIWNGRNLRK